MSKKRKRKGGGGFGGGRRSNSPVYNGADPDTLAYNAIWLAQFAEEPSVQLTPTQEEFVAILRAQYPDGKIGRKDGKLHYYTVDPELGPFSGPLPES